MFNQELVLYFVLIRALEVEAKLQVINDIVFSQKIIFLLYIN